MFFMIIYLKHTMEALQTLIIISTTDISNSTISITTCVIGNKIHRLINIQTSGNKVKQIVIWNNAKIMVDVKIILPSPNIDLPTVAWLASPLGCVFLEAFVIFVDIINRKQPIRYKHRCI